MLLTRRDPDPRRLLVLRAGHVRTAPGSPGRQKLSDLVPLVVEAHEDAQVDGEEARAHDHDEVESGRVGDSGRLGLLFVLRGDGRLLRAGPWSMLIVRLGGNGRIRVLDPWGSRSTRGDNRGWEIGWVPEGILFVVRNLWKWVRLGIRKYGLRMDPHGVGIGYQSWYFLVPKVRGTATVVASNRRGDT
jgi:hypothetical protein